MPTLRKEINAMWPITTQTPDGIALQLAKVSRSSMLRSRGCCICWRGILAVVTLKTSGYKMENPFPTGSTIPVGHYIAQLQGITGNFCRQLCSYKTSGHISRGDHILPRPHFIVLLQQHWLLTNTAESPEPTRHCPRSEMPQQSNHKRYLCQESHNSYFSPQSTFSIYLSRECPLHHHCQKQPDSLWLNTAQASLTGCIFLSLKCFNCIKYLTPLTMM